MHTHIYVCTKHTCARTHMHARKHTCMHTRTCARAHMAYAHMRTHAHAPWHMRTCAHSHLRTHAHAHRINKHTTETETTGRLGGGAIVGGDPTYRAPMPFGPCLSPLRHRCVFHALVPRFLVELVDLLNTRALMYRNNLHVTDIKRQIQI